MLERNYSFFNRKKFAIPKVFALCGLAFFLWGYTIVNNANSTNWEIPNSQKTETLTFHTGYTTSYNHEHHIPNWVAYELSPSELNGINERTDKFLADPNIKPSTCVSGDYTKSGYDRGHLAPAGDMTWSTLAMKESFFMSNICPQSPPLNRGIWKDLESEVRKYVSDKNHSLFIITGPIIESKLESYKNWQLGTIGKSHQVSVPRYCFKALLDTVGIDKSVAYIIPNSTPGISFQQYKNVYGGHANFRITVDSLERVLGRNLYPKLPKNTENKAESKIGIFLE